MKNLSSGLSKMTEWANPVVWVILIVIFILLMMKTCERNNTPQVPVDETKLQDSVDYWRDKYGMVYKQYEVTELSLQQLKQLQTPAAVEVKRKVKEAGIKLKNVASVAVVETKVEDSVQIAVHDTIFIHDSTVVEKQVPFTWQDSFAMIRGSVDLSADTGKVIIKGVGIHYEVTEKYTTIWAYKRPDGVKNVFKPKRLSITIVSDNPNVTIGKVQTYAVAKVKTPLVQRWWFNQLIGAAAGSTATFLLMQKFGK